MKTILFLLCTFMVQAQELFPIKDTAFTQSGVEVFVRKSPPSFRLLFPPESTNSDIEYRYVFHREIIWDNVNMATDTIISPKDVDRYIKNGYGGKIRIVRYQRNGQWLRELY